MVNYTIKLELNDYQANMIDLLSQKTNIDATNLIKQAINEYIEKNLIEEDKRYFIENKQRMKKTMDEKDKEWRVHWIYFISSSIF